MANKDLRATVYKYMNRDIHSLIYMAKFEDDSMLKLVPFDETDTLFQSFYTYHTPETRASIMRHKLAGLVAQPKPPS